MNLLRYGALIVGH